MGFDIKGFISKVEQFVNEGKADRQGKTDGKIDAFEKASLFNNKELLSELKNACEEDQSVQQQVQDDLGISLSSIKTRIEELNNARRASRAGGNNGGDGDGNGTGGYNVTGSFVNFINAPTNINITINISTEIKNEINNNLNCGCDGPGGADIDALVDILVKLLGDGGTVQEFILYIFQQFSTQLGLDLGNIQDLLKQVLEKLDQQEQTINKLTEYLIESMKKNYNALVSMGLKMDALIEIVQQGNADNLDILGKIYTAIMDLTGKFQDFTEVEKNQFNAIMDMLKQGNVNLEQVLALLNAIKNDTSENNEISQNILNAIKEGNTKILEALTKIDTDFNQFGDDIKAKLTEILNSIIVGGGGGGDVTINVDLNEVLDMLKAMLEKLNSIDNNTAENKEISKQILDAVKQLIDIGNTNNELQTQTNELIKQLTTFIKSIQFGGGGEGGTVVIDIQAIIDAINNNGADISSKLNELIMLMTTINGNIVQGNEDNIQMGEKILAAIAKLGTDIIGSLNVIIQNMGGDSEKLDKLLAFLEKMDANNKERVDKLLDAIAKLTITGGGGGDVTINVDVSAIIDAINNAGGDLNSKMDDIIKLLNTINDNVVQGNEDAKKLAQDIIDAINKLGFDVAGSLATIIAKMDGDAAKMEELLEFLKTMDANNAERNKAILDAIANLGVDVIKALNDLDIKVTVEGGGEGAPTDLTAVIDAINNNGADISSKLNDIFMLLTTLNGNVVQGNTDNMTIAQRILDAIVNIGTIQDSGGNTLSLDEVIDLLKQILEAIKNHEVTITIDGDGTCHCHCGDDSTHEGENNDWGNVLNARARAAAVTGIQTVSTSQADAKQNAKKVVLNGQYGLKGPHVVKDNGDGTVDVYNMGGQLVRNHVPKE